MFIFMGNKIVTAPRTKWDLAVAIEKLAADLHFDPCGAKRNRTLTFDYFTKDELREEYYALYALSIISK